MFDQVEARAWVLAVWIVRDVQLADELVVSVFAADAGSPEGHDRLVCDVRRLAIATAPAPRSAHVAGEAVRETILSLPDAQREAVELSLFGGLSIDGLAAVTRTPRPVVIDLLVDAMRMCGQCWDGAPGTAARSRRRCRCRRYGSRGPSAGPPAAVPTHGGAARCARSRRRVGSALDRQREEHLDALLGVAYNPHAA